MENNKRVFRDVDLKYFLYIYRKKNVLDWKLITLENIVLLCNPYKKRKPYKFNKCKK